VDTPRYTVMVASLAAQACAGGDAEGTRWT